MKTNGYKLREAIKQMANHSSVMVANFEPSLKAFPGETKERPQAVMSSYLVAESRLSDLQVAQAEYNLRVKVSYKGNQIPLSMAIKLVGGLARAEKMWRKAGTPETKESYYNRDDVREEGQIRAGRTVSEAVCLKESKSIAKDVSELRQAIAIANAVEVDIESLVPALFE